MNTQNSTQSGTSSNTQSSGQSGTQSSAQNATHGSTSSSMHSSMQGSAQKAADSARDNTQKAADGARDMAKSVSEGAKDAVQSTRRMANDALDKAEDGIKQVKQEIDPVIDDLAARAQEFASRSINYCAETGERARRQLTQTADATCRYVSDQPGKSMLMAAAAGAALATAFMMTRRSDR